MLLIALYIILALLLLLAVIALIRAAVRVEYSEEGLLVQAKIAFITITLIPEKKKSEKKQKKAKKEKPEKEKKTEPVAEKPKKGGSFDKIKKLLPPVIETLKRFFRKLCIDDLTVHYTSGGDDPFNTAMMFGRAAMGIGIIMPLLDSAFKIKKRDIKTSVDFNGGGDRIYINAQISFAVWELIYIACAVLPALLKISGKTKETVTVKE